MRQENIHPIFSVTEEEKEMVRKELGLKQNVIEEDIDAIMDWFSKQPHLAPAGLPERDFVERMLINAKGSREKTKRRIDNFYKHRFYAPELIQNRDQYIDLNKMWTFYRQTTIPKLLELKRVTVLQFTDPDPNIYDIAVVMKTAILLGDIRLRHDYMVGDIWVIDLKNTSISHLLRTNPTIFAKASRIFLDGLGVRVFSIHILGAPPYTNQFMQFARKFASPKIADRVKFHDTLEELYQFVPKKYLPKEYGGDEPSLDYAAEKYMSVFRTPETKKLLAECSRQVSDESRRPDANRESLEYLDGSFKQLDFD